MPLATLKRSNDRKVTNKVSKDGKRSTVLNTFGLPSGIAYSCRGETSVCKRVCYAGKLEKLYPSVRNLLIHNWNALQDATYQDMLKMLHAMIVDYKKDCAKHPSIAKIFRIHWDGDFFSDTYTEAWKNIIISHPDVQFWVYTRVESSAIILKDLHNLGLYYSTDSDNNAIGTRLFKDYGIKLAYLEDTFDKGGISLTQITGKVGAMCPENKGVIPLISTEGSACARCRLCVDAKCSVRFSITKG